MRCAVTVLATLCLSVASAGEQVEQTHVHASGVIADTGVAVIQININPEARVTASFSGAMPPPASCGTSTDLRVRIVNEAFLTAALDAELVGSVPAQVTLEFEQLPLTGAPEEFRRLRLTPARSGSTDVTVEFRARHHGPNLGGRNRVHFILRCR